MILVKESIVKAVLWLLRSRRLPIWGHTTFVASKILGLLGLVIAARFTLSEERWGLVGGKALWAMSLAVLCMVILWFAIAMTNYYKYKELQGYQKSVTVLRQLGRILGRFVIWLTVGLVVLGVIFGAGT